MKYNCTSGDKLWEKIKTQQKNVKKYREKHIKLSKKHDGYSS